MRSSHEEGAVESACMWRLNEYPKRSRPGLPMLGSQTFASGSHFKQYAGTLNHVQGRAHPGSNGQVQLCINRVGVKLRVTVRVRVSLAAARASASSAWACNNGGATMGRSKEDDRCN